MIALKQIITETAYEGALMAFKPDTTEAEIVSQIQTVLSARNVSPAGVTVTGEGGASFNSLVAGDNVIVTISTPTAGNVPGPQLFGSAQTLTATATGIRQ